MKQARTNNSNNRFLLLPVLHMVLEFLADPESLISLAQTSTTSLTRVKEMTQTYRHLSRGLPYIWKEIAYTWCSYVSGMIGHGTEWSPYWVEWDIMKRSLVPCFTETICLRRLFDEVTVAVNPHAAFRNVNTSWAHYIVDFTLANGNIGAVRDFEATVFIDNLVDPDIVPRRITVSFQGGHRWYVGLISYGSVDCLIFGERITEDLVQVRAGELEVPTTTTIYRLGINHDKSDWSRIRRLQEAYDFSEHSGKDVMKDVDFCHPEVSLELYALG